MDRGCAQGNEINGATRATRRVVLVGNPGVGKSHLLGMLSGNPDAFPSGYSIGAGLTRYRQSVTDCDAGIEWVDTPGLADIVTGHKNAEQITLALRKQFSHDTNFNTFDKNNSSDNEDGDATVVLCIFVMTLDESGHIRKADIDTMQCIRNAMPHCHHQYPHQIQPHPFVIVNKCAQDEDRVKMQLRHITPTSHVHVVRKGEVETLTEHSDVEDDDGVHDYDDVDDDDDDGDGHRSQIRRKLRRFVDDALHITQLQRVDWSVNSCVVYKDPAAERKLCSQLDQAVVEMRQRLHVARTKQVKTRVMYTAVGVALFIGAMQAVRQLEGGS